MDGLPDEPLVKSFLALADQHPTYAFITLWLVLIFRGIPVILKALSAWRDEHSPAREKKAPEGKNGQGKDAP